MFWPENVTRHAHGVSRSEKVQLKSPRLDPDVIADIYDAALEPDGLGRIPNLIGRLAGIDSVSLCILENGRVVDLALSDSLRENGDKFDQVEGAVAHGGSHDRIAELLMHAAEKPAAAGETIDLAPGVLASVGLHAPEARRSNERDGKVLKELLPHVKRALQLRLRHGRPQGGNA